MRVNAQDSIPFALNFNLTFGSDSLKTETYYPYRTKDSVSVNAFRFYISHVEFLDNGNQIFLERESYHLIDVNVKKSQELSITVPADVNINQLRFYLGIDSLTNVSGAKGGDLDPTRGMYWTWQSGYINFKLEGNSNVCKTRKNEYTFHSGGYSLNQKALQTITLPVTGNAATVSFDLKQFFSAVDLDKFNHIMSPGAESKLLALLASKIFRIL
jgi:hypothetical protein